MSGFCEVGVYVAPAQYALSNAHEAFDESGALKDLRAAKGVRRVVEQLLRMRVNVPSSVPSSGPIANGRDSGVWTMFANPSTTATPWRGLSASSPAQPTVANEPSTFRNPRWSAVPCGSLSLTQANSPEPRIRQDETGTGESFTTGDSVEIFEVHCTEEFPIQHIQHIPVLE